jgi:DNA ligase-associated metallophosphoesterase
MAVSVSFAGQVLHPLPCGALFWPAEDMLLVADLHLEKGSHFAARGWPLPPHDSLETLGRLAQALEATGASRLAALGDSLHDREALGRMSLPARQGLERLLAGVDWLWITGNHDGEAPAALGGRVVPEQEVGGLVLRHESLAADPRPEISGHLHPCARVPLRTGRAVVRRCFLVGAGRLVLPAYGAFAGGLDAADPAFALLGPAREALVVTPAGLVHLPVAEARVA